MVSLLPDRRADDLTIDVDTVLSAHIDRLGGVFRPDGLVERGGAMHALWVDGSYAHLSLGFFAMASVIGDQDNTGVQFHSEKRGPMDRTSGNLTRPIQEMPDFVEEALTREGLMRAYRERPAYQQNDYLGWIARAKRTDTKLKRLDQMLDELRGGGVYMKMDHRPSRKAGR